MSEDALWKEEDLTWSNIGKWGASNTERDYSIMVKHQPIYEMDGTPFPNGKPYRVFLYYFLKGFQLFIATLKVDALEDKSMDFDSKNLVDLSQCSPITEIILRRKQHWLLSTYDKASCWGERFFFKPKRFWDKPYQPAFAIQFPEDCDHYKCKEAVILSESIKRRILKANSTLKRRSSKGNRRSTQ